MALSQHKEQLRKEFIKKRKVLSSKEWTAHSQKIIGRLKQLQSFKNARTVHCYVSMNERREVNTHPLIKEMLENGKKVVVPVADFKSGVINHVELKSFDELSLNKWGILEPEGGRQVPISDLDLIIVPMAGGDENGYRIGYGGGFYDRFLKDVSCLKVGLCFEQSIIKKLPIEPFDVQLNMIVSEERVLGELL